MSIKISLGTFNSSPVADSRGRVGPPHPKIVKIKYIYAIMFYANTV